MELPCPACDAITTVDATASVNADQSFQWECELCESVWVAYLEVSAGEVQGVTVSEGPAAQFHKRKLIEKFVPAAEL